MEATINGGAVLTAKLQAFLFLVGPAVQDLVGYAARQKCRFGSGAEDDPGTWKRGPRYLGPECIELMVCHPVLGVQQHIGVKRIVLNRLKVFGKIAIEHTDPACTLTDFLKCSRLR